MRAAFWVLLLLALSVALFLAVRYDSGYVLIVSPPWRVELSLSLAIALALLLFLVAYLVVRLARGALLLPGDMRAWRERRRKGRAEDDLSRAIAALLARQPEHARKLADKAMARNDTPLCALVAGYAALGQADAPAARAYLARLESAAQPTDNGELVAARQALGRAVEAGGAPLQPAASGTPIPPG